MNDDSSKTCHVPAEGQNQNYTHNFNQGDNTWFINVIVDVLKLSSNFESLFSFKFSAEKKSDLKEYKALSLSFEALSLLN